MYVQVVPVTVAVPMSVPPRKMCTASVPTSAADRVPESVGVVSLVYPLFATVPCTGSRSSVIASMVTVVDEPEVFTVIEYGPENPPVLPDLSSTRAVYA